MRVTPTVASTSKRLSPRSIWRTCPLPMPMDSNMASSCFRVTMLVMRVFIMLRMLKSMMKIFMTDGTALKLIDTLIPKR